MFINASLVYGLWMRLTVLDLFDLADVSPDSEHILLAGDGDDLFLGMLQIGLVIVCQDNS